jgi:hypothetical protein
VRERSSGTSRASSAVREQFQKLGSKVLGLATEINDRYEFYDTMLKQLDAELIKVGDEVNRH